MEEKRRESDTKLDEILRMVGEIKTTIAVFSSDLHSLKETSKENKEAIKGNGKPGLETRTVLLEKQMGVVNWVGAVLLLAILGDIMTRILGI